MTNTVLLDNIDADDTSSEFIARGGAFLAIVRATAFSTGIVTIQIASVNDALNRWTTLTDGTFTANGQVKIDYLPIGTRLRAVLASADGSTDAVYVEILQ